MSKKRMTAGAQRVTQVAQSSGGKSAEVKWADHERKLNYLLTDIQENRLKVAQNDLDRFLKKNKESQPALALQVYIASKTRSNVDDILQGIERVQSTGDLTQRSLYLCAHAAQRVWRFDLVVDMYSRAWTATGTEDLDSGASAFLAASMSLEVTTMLKTSRLIHQHGGKEPAWARRMAFSAWLESVTTDDLDNQVEFPIATNLRSQMMASIAMATSGAGSDTWEVLWLRLAIALAAGKDQKGLNEAWKQVRTNSRNGASIRRLHGMSAVKAIEQRGEIPGMWEEEWDETTDRLWRDEEAAHNYEFFLYLFHIFRRIPSPQRAEELRSLFDDLHEKFGAKERAPQLALLHFDSILVEMGMEPLYSDKGWEAEFKHYFTRWARWVVLSEIDHIAGSHRKAKVIDILRELQCRSSTNDHLTIPNYISQTIAMVYISRQAGTAWAPNMDDFRLYWNKYLVGREYGPALSLLTMDGKYTGHQWHKTQLRPADDVGILAVHVLVKIWEREKDELYLIQAAACIEYILVNSPSSTEASLLAIQIYRILGAPAAYEKHLISLDLSEVLLDTLFHLALANGGLQSHVASVGARVIGVATGQAIGETWRKFAIKAMGMFDRMGMELPNQIKDAIEREAYSKVAGMKETHRRYISSVTLRLLELDLANLHTVTQPATPIIPFLFLRLGFKGKAVESSWADNRTTTVLPDGISPKFSIPTKSWINAMTSLTVRIVETVQGKSLPKIDEISLDGLDPVDRAYYSAIDGILLRLNEDVKGKAERPEGLNIFGASVSLCLEPGAKHREFFVLGQLVVIVKAILNRFKDALMLIKDPVKRTQADETRMINLIETDMNSFNKQNLDQVLTALDVLHEPTPIFDKLYPLFDLSDLSEMDIHAKQHANVSFVHEFCKSFAEARSGYVQGLKYLLQGKI